MNPDHGPYVITPQIINRMHDAANLDPAKFLKIYEFCQVAYDSKPMIDQFSNVSEGKAVANLNVSVCYSCKKAALWCGYQLVYPSTRLEIQPHPDLPGDARRDFEEAAAIVGASPRGAAALLRLSIQKLLKELGKPGKNINDDIGSLVRDGLPAKIQKALDVVRVIGNNAVHPGEIDIQDDKATAMGLFTVVNIIVEHTITQDKQLDAMFSSLPQGALNAIEKRDKPKAP